ncbi:MAG: hypothetical protein ACLTSK_00875 [Christensenellales bacterium]
MSEMTPRLKRIVELLPVSDELFDVGCDHGIVEFRPAFKQDAKTVLPTLVARVSKGAQICGKQRRP